MPSRLCASILAALLVFIPSAFVPSALSAKKFASVAPLYYDTHNVCTAWAIQEGAGLWVTAAHCVMREVAEDDTETESPNALAHTYKVQDQEATVVALVPIHDLAILHTAKGAEGLRLAKRGPEVGDEVTALGFPLGEGQPLFSRGTVASVAYHSGGRTLAWFALPLCQGHSGSPIFNKRHEVVSIFQLMTDTPCASFALGPTWDTMVTILGGMVEERYR